MKMNLKVPIGKNSTVGEMDSKAGMIRVGIRDQYRRYDQSRDQKYRDRPQPQERSQSYYEDREYDIHSRDDNTRGRSLATSRSEEYSAEQVTYDYTDVRLKDLQTATRSDYSDLLGHSSGSGYASRSTGHWYNTHTAAKVQVFNSMPPNWNHHPALIKTD